MIHIVSSDSGIEGLRRRLWLTLLLRSDVIVLIILMSVFDRVLDLLGFLWLRKVVLLVVEIRSKGCPYLLEVIDEDK